MVTSIGLERKVPFNALLNADEAERKNFARLGRLPFALQIRRVNETDWVTIAKGPTFASLMGKVAVCDHAERRVLNRNTVTRTWAVNEKAGEQ